MQNKRLVLGMSILVLVVGAAAFIGGRLLHGNAGPLRLGMTLGGNGGMVSMSIQVTPAPELPTTQPEVIGSFVERKDKTLVIQAVSMSAGQGGGIVVQSSSGGGGEAVAGSPWTTVDPEWKLLSTMKQ